MGRPSKYFVPKICRARIAARRSHPEALANATLAWFDSPEKVADLERQFTELHHQLKRNTSELAAHAISQVLQAIQVPRA